MDKTQLLNKAKQTFAKVKQFLKEAKVEVKKVAWPTPRQTLASTSVVLIVVVVISLFLGIVDFGISKIIRLALG